MGYTDHYKDRKDGLNFPQTERRNKLQVRMLGGGYGYKASALTMLRRFLVLGVLGNTFYVTKKMLLDEFSDAVDNALNEDYVSAIEMIIEVSDKGLAPKIDPSIFALAVALSHGDLKVRNYAKVRVHQICRIPTHYFSLADSLKKLRGWSPWVSDIFNQYYMYTPVESLTFHMVKYQQRNGWSHADLIRLCHPKPDCPEREALFRWALGGTDEIAKTIRSRFTKTGYVDGPRESLVRYTPTLITAYEVAKTEVVEGYIHNMVRSHGLTEEMVPTQFRGKDLWEVLVPNLGYFALLRNITRMAEQGYLVLDNKEAVDYVIERLMKPNKRAHPIDILKPYLAYKDGQYEGRGGAHRFPVVPAVTDALWDTFHNTFENVVPTNAVINLNIDHSGSMCGLFDFGGVSATARQMSALLAYVFLRTEKYIDINRYGMSIHPCDITAHSNLASIEKAISGPSEGTDCSLPLKRALEEGLKYDAIVEFTDGETWGGLGHVEDWLEKYRKVVNPDMKFIIVQMMPYGTQMVPDDDPLSFEIVGMDSSMPKLVNNFIKGEF